MSVSLYGSGQTVIQVASTTLNTAFSMSGATLTPVTGLSVSITPQSTTSKILILASITLAGTNGQSGVVWSFAKNGSPIDQGAPVNSQPYFTGGMAYIPDPNSFTTCAGSYLDSPSTTSATTYSIQVASSGTSGVYVNRSQNYANTTSNYNGTTTSTITVMEIAYS